MTGLDPERDAVVEVCIERWVGDELESDSFESLVTPARARSARNAHVHGISDEMRRRTRPPSPSAPTIVERI